MRIIYFGSDKIGIECLEELKKKYKLVCVITAPDKPKGRGLKILPTPVKEWAIKNKISVLEPKNFDSKFIEKLKELKPSLIVLFSYGKKIPPEILKIPEFGTINIHPSLLPKYRGAAPVEWTLINGEKETGITVIKMDEEIDHGEIIVQEKFPITHEDNALTLKEKISKIAPEVLIKAIEKIKNGEKTIPQKGMPIYARKLEKKDGLIEWSKNAESIVNLIRGTYLWPVAHTYIEEKNGKKQIKIYKGEVSEKEGIYGIPGEILKIGKDYIEVACGKGKIKIKEVQIEGKKRLPVSEFLKGYRNLKEGSIFKS